MKLDYWYFENFFNSDQIKKINHFIDNNFYGLEKEELNATDTQQNKIKYASVKLINWEKIKHLTNELDQKLYNVNQENFGYDIYPINNNDVCNLNIYSSKMGSKYGWHIDQSENDIFDIKFTVLINLSFEIYKGGEFKLFNGNEYEVKEINKPGNVIMFKSFLNHSVLPITEGERRTLAIFIKGPRFK